MELFNQKCIILNTSSTSLKPKEIDSYLSKINLWKLIDNKYIEKKFAFNNYKESLIFINLVSELAEQENHHPDISFGWGYAKISIHTHDLNGLHKNDFILASKIDKIS
ncbi:MAG: 4a-hydroxytetrahydrobiopterin dehydratase [Rhodospirillaceae bacterium]|nr:4a-hydroxytetrahydrobiopterin dehydratase [Rhodospirillaceae bacterium]|tara:strand:- start:16647 stop:16970 length:324 start_codon:yes stop_codon:yes gene_type:complete